MYRLLRRFSWFLSSFVKKYRLILIGSAVFTIGISILAYILLPYIPTPKKHTYYGLVGKYTATQIPPVIEAKLGLGLTFIGPDQTPLPAAATSWSVSPDGTTYKFKLDTSLHWSDGKPLSVSDISISIPDVKVNQIQPDTLEFILPETFAPFPSILSKPLLKDGIYTLGRFSVATVDTDGPYLRRITLNSETDIIDYFFYPSISQAVIDFKLGKIDHLLSLLEQPILKDWPNLTSTPQTDLHSYVAIFFNLQDQIFQNNKELRQGLAYAIQDKSMGYRRAVSPFHPDSWAFNAAVKPYEFSRDRAKELITKGKPSGQNTIKFELSTTPDLIPIAERLKADWVPYGVEADIKIVTSRPTNFQALLFPQVIPQDPDQYIYWHSTQSTNLINYIKKDVDVDHENDKIDKLLEDGRKAKDQASRRVIYLDFQRFLAELCPAIFLYYPNTYNVDRL